MTLRGIDVSSNQGFTIDWPTVAKQGIAFAFCKVTEGAGWLDETAPRNAAGIKAAGLIRGFYGFARPDLGNTPQEEALYFLDHIPDLAAGDLLALDLEVPTSGPGAFDAFALTWLAIVQGRTGVRPLLYTGQWYAQELGRLQDRRLGQFGLWNAAYAPQQPPAYAPWSAVALWQHTDCCSIAGIGLCDESLYSGTSEQLRALGVPDPTPPAPPQAARPHWKVVMPTHLRPRPQLDAVPLGPLLPAGTFVAECDPPPGWPAVTAHWKSVRTGGDIHGYIFTPDVVPDSGPH